MQFIKTFKNFLSKNECKVIINENSKKELESGNIGNGVSLQELKKIRDAKIVRIENKIVQSKLETLLKEEIKLKGYELGPINKFQFIKYDIGGHYDWHSDSGDGEVFRDRFCTVVIQLNNDYEGGDLLYKESNMLEYAFEKGIGNLFIFNSNLLHKVTPITTGNRFSLVTWITLKRSISDKKPFI